MELDNKNIKFSTLLLQFLFCFIGVIATIYVVVLDNNAIVASALVSIIIGFFTVIINDENHYSWATFCGSFAGMTAIFFLDWNGLLSPMSLQFLINAVILSSLTALLYSLSEFFSIKYPKVFFDGYGGRLGTIAFLSVVLFLFLCSYIYPSKVVVTILNKSMFHGFDPIDLLAIPTAVLASLVSMEIKNTASSLNDNYKVISVATTGIIGGLLITEIPVYGTILGQAWYTGAFVGMTSYFVLMLKRDYLITGLISGLLLVLTKNLFVGFGGKLGLISFIAVVMVRLYYFVSNKISLIKLNSGTVLDELRSGDVKNQVVDDDYARQLVEDLQKAKQSGENIPIEDLPITESFVIGEKADYIDDDKEYDAKISEVSKLIESLSIYSWCCFGGYGDDFVPVLHNGISDATLLNLSFNKELSFIKKFSDENRVLAFKRSNGGLDQKFFTDRVSKEDLSVTNMVIIYPMEKNGKLKNFFMIFDKNDFETAKNDFHLLNQYFNSTNLHK